MIGPYQILHSINPTQDTAVINVYSVYVEWTHCLCFNMQV